METFTQEVLSQFAFLIISLIFTVIGNQIRSYLKEKRLTLKYSNENEIMERILANAVGYAEQIARNKAKELIAGKKGLAIDYIEAVNPNLAKKYSKELDIMLERKVHQIKRGYTTGDEPL